jgi:hypothetical protein
MDSKTKLEIKESDFARLSSGNIPTNEEAGFRKQKRFRVHSIAEKLVWQMFKLLKADTTLLFRS